MGAERGLVLCCGGWLLLLLPLGGGERARFLVIPAISAGPASRNCWPRRYPPRLSPRELISADHPGWVSFPLCDPPRRDEVVARARRVLARGAEGTHVHMLCSCWVGVPVRRRRHHYQRHLTFRISRLLQRGCLIRHQSTDHMRIVVPNQIKALLQKILIFDFDV